VRSTVDSAVLGAIPEQDLGAADGEGVAVHERDGVDPLALDEGAVGGAQVAGDGVAVRQTDLQVTAGDAGVVDDEVRPRAPVEVSFLVNNNPNAPAIEIESSTRRGAARPPPSDAPSRPGPRR